LLPLLPREQRQMLSSQQAARGSYLIITAPQFLNAVTPLAEWKREKGLIVEMATTDETGTTLSGIRGFIQERYDNAPVPPQYVLLVGDVAQIPGLDYHSSISDHLYAMMDGDDFLPDLHVGRLAVQNDSEAQTFVAKILGYEQAPYMDEGSDWFSRGLMVAGNYASDTPVPVSRWCREQMLEIGYAAVDSVYFPPYWNDYGQIAAAVNAGVSLISYRGWAYGIHGWEPPHFTTDEVLGLTNGWKLPVVFSWVCQNNDFAHDEMCFGEAWTRAGTAQEPKGAVAFIGNSEPWSHTRFNDATAIGAFNAIRNGVTNLGAILTASKMEVLAKFPDTIPYDPYEDNSVEFYFYIYSLLGDPEMEIWMAPPQEISVDYAPNVPAGINYVDVRVSRAGTTDPIAGAYVGISNDEEALGGAWTGVDGVAHIPVELHTPGTVSVTVTEAGVMPYRGTLTVAAADMFLAHEDVVVGDAEGNGDGVPNPGETLALSVVLHNHGLEDAEGVTATLEALGDAEVVTGTAVYPDIASGAEAQPEQPFMVQIPGDAGDRRRFGFRLIASTPLESATTEFVLEVQAPALRHASHSLDGEGYLDPGETGQLVVTIENDGRLASSAASAELRALNPEVIDVTGASGTFGPAAPGEAVDCEGTFTIVAAEDAFIGQVAGFELTVTTAEGYDNTTAFAMVVGQVDHRAPLGPDAGGYYAYDNSDTDYPDTAPLYDWITCSTAYGGQGTALDLRDNQTAVVELPFSFTYYDQSYDSILVSDNGWIAFDVDPYHDFYNWPMPNNYGCGAQVAVFWDNLDPRKEVEGVRVGDGIYHLYDPERNLFVVEWSRQGNVRDELDDLQTFQVILYDPEHHPTESGNGIIDFQYKQIVNDDYLRMYS
ncbi:MAG: hypothetical protein GF355_09735, partial [Candidatus Eisenbacteria bacterium]|nr:hypothetical protein [Candidatus Eisenbacteria bacterium]